MTISSLIAKVGSNPYWIAANAHAWFACSMVLMGVPWWVIVLAAGGKEFIFDARYELDPPQTFMDNLTDFAGYCVGVGIGALYAFY